MIKRIHTEHKEEFLREFVMNCARNNDMIKSAVLYRSLIAKGEELYEAIYGK